MFSEDRIKDLIEKDLKRKVDLCCNCIGFCNVYVKTSKGSGRIEGFVSMTGPTIDIHGLDLLKDVYDKNKEVLTNGVYSATCYQVYNFLIPRLLGHELMHIVYGDIPITKKEFEGAIFVSKYIKVLRAMLESRADIMGVYFMQLAGSKLYANKQDLVSSFLYSYATDKVCKTNGYLTNVKRIEVLKNHSCLNPMGFQVKRYNAYSVFSICCKEYGIKESSMLQFLYKKRKAARLDSTRNWYNVWIIEIERYNSNI